eukprot:Nk52_evm1s297 gene=Nk52_evmTU1s297
MATNLSRRNLMKMQNKFACKIKSLIIDEYSMVPYNMLIAIDERLKQFKGNNEPWGGCNVIQAGDLAQLPPIGLSNAALPPRNATLAARNAKTWFEENFKDMVRLDVNVRQGGQSEGAKILKEILTAIRNGDFDRGQYEKLKRNVIAGGGCVDAAWDDALR